MMYVPCQCGHLPQMHNVKPWVKKGFVLNCCLESTNYNLCSCMKYKADNLRFLEMKAEENELQ